MSIRGPRLEFAVGAFLLLALATLLVLALIIAVQQIEGNVLQPFLQGRSMQLHVMNDQGTALATHKLFYGSKLMVRDGDKVTRGQKMFEWDPYTLPIIAEKGGIAKFVDLLSGISVRDETDDATGMTQKIVTDWRSAPKGNDLKPEIIIMGEDGEPVRNDQGNPISYPMSVDAILSIEDGQEVKAGDVVKVKVLEVDVKRQRIALTMRLDDEFGAAAAPRSGGGAQQDRGRSGGGGRGAQQQRSREPEAGGAMAAAFAKLKQK